MTRVAILDDYQQIAHSYADWSRLGPDVETVAFDRHLHGVDEAAGALADFDAVCLLRERMPFPRALIERLPRLKFIVFSGRTSENLDWQAASERGIVVSHTDPASKDRGGARGGGSGVAEATWGLILACARNLCFENENIRNGDWRCRMGLVISGKTLGVIGLGRVGRKVAAIGQAFGMDVLAWSENMTPEKAAEAGATAVSREELFSRADFVTVHLRLSDRTVGLIGAQDFARMKPTGVFINTSRGAIVDEAALVAALKEGTIRSAGLDVFQEEPLPASNPLQKLENAILTPHNGYLAEGNYKKAYEGMIEAVAAWHAGNPINVYKGRA